MTEQIVIRATIPEGTRSGLARLADIVLPGTQLQPRGSEVGAHGELLDRVLAADPALTAPVLAFGERASTAVDLTFTDMQSWSEPDCEQVVFALTAAYYMSSTVRRLIGYPGQGRRPIAQATPEEICSDELIEPVVARGPIYLPTPGT